MILTYRVRVVLAMCGINTNSFTAHTWYLMIAHSNHPVFKALPLGSAALITALAAWVVIWTLLQFQVPQFG